MCPASLLSASDSFSCQLILLSAGDKLAIVGPNGAGEHGVAAMAASRILGALVCCFCYLVLLPLVAVGCGGDLEGGGGDCGRWRQEKQ